MRLGLNAPGDPARTLLSGTADKLTRTWISLRGNLILAAVNEALRSANALMESKMSGLIPGDLGGLGGLLGG